MKKQKVNSNINLEELAGGAFAEKFNEALAQVAENIQNHNTDATAKRGITVNVKFSPNKTRQIVSTSISVTTKLAATEAIDAQMVMGLNMKTGEIEIAEYDGQIRGQSSLFEQSPGEPEPPKEEEQDQETEQPAGKPLDLRKRSGKEYSEAVASVAASGMIAGKDFDPVTGEVYDKKNKNIIPIKKAAQM